MTNLVTRRWTAAAAAMLLLMPGLAGQGAAELPRGSYQLMDYGPVIAETVTAEWPAENTAHKGLAVRLAHQSTMIFDTDLMRWSAGAVDGWIDLSVSSHTRTKGRLPPPLEGRQVFGTDSIPGWAYRGSFADPREGQRGALPREWARWRGFYRYGDRVLLSYRAAGMDVLESPSVIQAGETRVFVRSMRLSSSEETAIHHLARLRPGTIIERRGDTLVAKAEDRSLAFHVETSLSGAHLRGAENDAVELVLPAHANPVSVSVLIWEEEKDAQPLGPAAVREAVRAGAIDFEAARRGGPTRWGEEVAAAVEMADDDAAYVTDAIGLPFENPWHSWIRPSAFNFFAGGDRAAMATWNGDIWIVSGLLSGGDEVRWRRFASGLYYPMGIVVVDGIVHVTERSQLTRLHDLNGDGEADFYESFNNDGILHPMAHSLCLEVDSEGNFYFFKNGNRVPEGVPEHGALIRISADGSKREVYASGIRGANGLGIDPRNRLFSADQQGNWVPTARVDWLRKDGFYGYRPHNPRGYPEGEFDPPVCWIPHRIDNSSGGLAFIDDERWGPMNGNWVIASYGQAKLMTLLIEDKGGLLQGGIARFPLDFDAGLMRTRVNPGDGQLYVLGMKGWQTIGEADGSFDRVRYTGKPSRMPIGLEIEPGVVRIRFSETIDPHSVILDNFKVERWQYIYSEKYGSPEMSIENPDQQGRDPVQVAGVMLDEDGRTVVLAIPDLKPVMQQSVEYRLRFADGGIAENAVYHTIHRLSATDEVESLVVRRTVGEAEESADAGGSDVGPWDAFAAGLEIFESTCSVCHQVDGNGIAPALGTSAWAGGRPEALIRILLHGKIGEKGTMMPFSWLSDDELASLLSYIRVRWHDKEPITPAEVQAVRRATEGHSGLWTDEELTRVAQ